jgi:hypothetical protein
MCECLHIFGELAKKRLWVSADMASEFERYVRFGMWPVNRIWLIYCILFLFWNCAYGQASAQTVNERLFEEALAGSDCKQTANNGLLCEYRLGKRLHIAIKDAGGGDQVIGFRHSDINDDYYGVMYFGCIVIVPGLTNLKKYGKDDGAFIAPRNGRIYKTLKECRAANGK